MLYTLLYLPWRGKGYICIIVSSVYNSIRKVSKSYRITNIIIDLCLWIDIIGRGGGRMKSPSSPVSLLSEPERLSGSGCATLDGVNVSCLLDIIK